ncbi:MAG: AAA family ATPase [Flavobacteriaceae bacterium]|nr:AAA family ATPase [Flavobacteriaceae bacterium]
MIIKELNLIAFGPFTNKTLSFRNRGLHIVFGPNESGKSSALRGLKSWLYGIDSRTNDNFIHRYEHLKIGGVLQKENGEILEFIRRKGSKNTLINSEGSPFDEDILLPFLQGVSDTLFTTLFGINHQELQHGGQEILDQKGELGKTLFSAGLGNFNLKKILDQLQHETDGLFKKGGSKPTINTLIKKYQDLKREIKDQSLSVQEWENSQHALESTEEKLRSIVSELKVKQARLNQLQRIQKVFPKLSQLKELEEEFNNYKSTIVLKDDFKNRRRKAMNEKEKAEMILKKISSRLNKLQDNDDTLSINQTLLHHSGSIKELFKRLGEVQKAKIDRPKLETNLKYYANATKEISEKIKPEFRLQDVEKYRLICDHLKKIQELSELKTSLDKDDENKKYSLEKEHIHLKNALKVLKDIPEYESLEALHSEIMASRKLGDLDSRIQSDIETINHHKNECQIDIARLSIWNGDLHSVGSLQLPPKEKITLFQEKFNHLKTEKHQLEKKKTTFQEELEVNLTYIDETQRKGEVPSEAILNDIRSKRDDIWQLLYRQWIEDEDISHEANKYKEQGPLTDIFEDHIKSSDELSDRLRREAEVVHKLATLESNRESLQRKLKIVNQKIMNLIEDENKLQKDWESLWITVDIKPLTPREMDVWVDKFEKIRDKAHAINQLQRQLSQNEAIRKNHIQELNKQLKQLNGSVSDSEQLDTVLQKSESQHKKIERFQNQRSVLTDQIKKKEKDIELLNVERQSITAKLQNWNHQWSELMQSIDLHSDANHLDIRDLIDSLSDYFENKTQEKQLSQRINAIDRDSENFTNQVKTLMLQIAPELSGKAVETIVLNLDTLLTKNSKILTQRQNIQKQIEDAENEKLESETMIDSMNQTLENLCEEAGCDYPEKLEDAEKASDEYLDIKNKMDSLKQQILDLGDGKTIDELITEVKSINNIDSLPGEIDQLKRVIQDELETKRNELSVKKGRHLTELEQLDGNDQVAEMTNQLESILSAIQFHSERYAHRKWALKVLRDQIEKYRMENQSPLINRASDYFDSLTLNSFERLRTDFNEKDESILTGIRANDDVVRVEGMSSGTRDQLYLALRLASFEKHIQNGSLMPLILDDVLVDFDDQRSQCALNVFAEIAEQTQVILFTHHSRIMEQSENINGIAHVYNL